MTAPISADRVRTMLGTPRTAVAALTRKPGLQVQPIDSMFEGRFAVQITDDQVRDMRRRYREGERVTDIANAHGVGMPMVSMIISGKRKGYVV